MAEIVPLEYPDTVTLLPGATQHWRDLGRNTVTVTPVLDRVIGEYLVDAENVLVVGAHSIDWLSDVASRANVTVVVRSIPDAAQIGRSLPDARVYCGDVQHLPAKGDGFDVVVAVTDLSRVLPLESEPRPWRRIYDEVTSLARPGGVAIVGIENDLGLHRLNSPANPRSRNWDQDWSPLATWDTTRPRTSTQVESLTRGPVWTLYPEWDRAKVAHTGDLSEADAVGRDAAVFDAAVWPLFGPDPAWYLQAASAAQRTADFAAGWLAMVGGEPRPAQVLRTTKGQTVEPVAAFEQGRNLLGVISEALACDDLPQVRRLLKAWSTWVDETGSPALLSTTVVCDDLTLATIGSAGDAGKSRWEALASLVAVIRGRGWRVPWPSTVGDAQMLAILGAMAGLDELSPVELAALHVKTPADMDPFRRLDRQELYALIIRSREQVNALRSRVRWNELQFLSHKVAGKTRSAKMRGMRLAKGSARRAMRLVGIRR